ncbi:sensor histidine kinase [Streptomyces violaceorubidus]|uniref:sensor histidine kinase n=1 Tax=Streptomyces violaceorubidus TaxID=284042 RepID=UPI00099811C5|nr:histidine kinase [Streptomyces violaceorubidus]
MISARRIREVPPLVVDVGLAAVAGALTVLAARLQVLGLPVYPQLTSGAAVNAVLPQGLSRSPSGGSVALLVCAALVWRRRRPVALTVATTALTVAWPVVVPLLVGLYTVADRCSARVTAWVSGLAMLPVAVQFVRTVQSGLHGVADLVAGAALVGTATGWGMVAADRRARAARAAADAETRVELARRRVREEIAREMHDVLAHRLTLLSMHAGALSYHPDPSPEQVREATGVIVESAGRALEDLQDILQVLRTPAVTARVEPPQPTLREVTGLVEETREAGMRVEFSERLEEMSTLDDISSRTGYRIVQEILTNHRKHAPRSVLRLALAGGRADGLTVTASNALDASPGPRRAVPGQGLVGMAERAQLAGGRMRQDRDAGVFRLEVWLPWKR